MIRRLAQRTLVCGLIGAVTAVNCTWVAGADTGLAELTELSLDQLLNVEVVSASRYAQRASDAPAAVTVVTAADICALGYRNLADALQGVPGFYTTLRSHLQLRRRAWLFSSGRLQLATAGGV